MTEQQSGQESEFSLAPFQVPSQYFSPTPTSVNLTKRKQPVDTSKSQKKKNGKLPFLSLAVTGRYANLVAKRAKMPSR